MTLISEAERRRRLAAAREAVEKGLPMAAAARALGMRPNTLLGWLHAEGAYVSRSTTRAGEIVALTFKCDKAADVVGGFFGWMETV